MDARVTFELNWSPEYAVGHPTIDQQHAKLFELYNLIVAGFSNGLGHDVLEPALKALLDYTRDHFADEERLMARLGYRELAAHRRAHQCLINEATSLAAELQDGQPVLLYELLSLVRNWLVDHILGEDLKLRELLAEW